MLRIVIAGGGFAGLEALLGLRALAPDVELTLVAPEPDFSYRPLAVGEPFARGRAHHVPLAKVAEDAGAELVLDTLVAVDDAAREAHLKVGRPPLSFDALLVATGAQPVEGVPGALTWLPEGDAALYGGLLRDLEEGYSKRVAIVIPPGASWPLPAYELAAMTAGEVRTMGQRDVEIVVVTPERKPLEIFGEQASVAVTEEMERAGVRIVTAAVARREGKHLLLDPSGDRLEIQRVVAVPRLLGPALEGLAADEDGFVLTGDDSRVQGAERTWAAGDGVASPVKFGGLATHQARVAIGAIARLAGATDVPDPGEAVLHGRLLIGGRSRELDTGFQWRPGGKVTGEYLPRWLVEHGVIEAAPPEEPAEGIEVRRPVRDIAPVTRHLFDLGREYRIADPQIANLGRRMREARGR